MRPVAEFDGPLTVGRYYLVPCISLRNVSRALPAVYRRFWWPIIGSSHADPELGAAYEHLHFDVRFISDRILKKWVGKVDPELALVRVQASTDVSRAMMRRRCARPASPVFPQAPTDVSQYPAFVALEQRHAHDVLCKTCPHRGMRAADMPIVDGVRVCHGHGLGWDVVTGALVKRHTREAACA